MQVLDNWSTSCNALGRVGERMGWVVAAVLLSIAGPAAVGLKAQSWMSGYFEADQNVLSPSAIPWAKYTHVFHFAASTDGLGNVIPYYLNNPSFPNSSISDFVAAGHNAGKKVLVSIKDNDGNLNDFPNSVATGATFINSIVAFVTSNGYDGVDLDWEKNVNTTNYENFLAGLRSAMPSQIITVAGNPGTASVAAASQTKLDQVNVMCYDLDWGDNFSWYVDALLRSGNNRVETCDWDVKQFTNAGVATAKLGMGMPFYGRRWPGVTQALQHSSFSKAITFLYRDLVTDPTRWQPQYQFYDNTYKANYLSISTTTLKEFDSYTGPQFISDAVSWAKAKGLGGYMTFSLYYEYLANQPADAAYPLSTALYDAVAGYPVNTTPPAVSGSALVGQTLSVSTGTWTGTPTSYAYQWEDCDSTGAVCTAITGATSSSYAVQSTDHGYTLRAAVTASNTVGSAAAISAQTAVVQ